MKRIAFVSKGKAALVDWNIAPLPANCVRIKTLYTAISAGTERANLMGDGALSPAVRGVQEVTYPRYLGYSSTGIVTEVGAACRRIKVGDTVQAFWTSHSEYQNLPEARVQVIPEGVDPEDAAFAFIGSFPLASIRKMRVEIGESAMVMGLGILGLFAIQFLNACGATPIIAADPNPERRALALTMGADYAFDSTAPDFSDNIRAITNGKGVNCVVEVSGVGAALNQALDVTAKMGRVALLGCTRFPTEVDFYHDVHGKGVSLIGAHTNARPDVESYPGHWTHFDDCRAIMMLCKHKKINIAALRNGIYDPKDCEAVYDRLATDKNFPIGVGFDWSKL